MSRFVGLTGKARVGKDTVAEHLVKQYGLMQYAFADPLKDMLEAVRETLPETDILIKAAAVADYRPVTVADQKIKKKDGDMSIPLERTDDILGWVEKNRHPGLFVCGFSMETENMVENSRAKLEKKHLDMIAANNLKTEGAGFGVATNVVTLITKDGIKELPLMGKDEVAGCLLDEIAARR